MVIKRMKLGKTLNGGFRVVSSRPELTSKKPPGGVSEGRLTAAVSI